MSDLIVIVREGKLKGAELESSLGTRYIAFRGIPFAAPPIGELRFKDPQPPESWTGVKDVSDLNEHICSQIQDVPPLIIGNEDCLYLNVYTNSLSQSKKSVMFWIHDGGFTIGSSSYQHFRPDYLLAKDVVVVTANYRLGAFGFLNLGDKVAPGNQGLKDIIAALEWVRENIASFGGDPDNVTIFGVSAGAALTHGLLMSPRAKGLFHKAILQSGLMKSFWAVNQSLPERGFNLAKYLGNLSNDPVEVVEFLRTVSAEDIAGAQTALLSQEERLSFNLAFGMNSDEIAENPVLPEPFEQLIKKEIDIPVMVSHTSNEFIMFLQNKSEQLVRIFNLYLLTHVRNLGSLKMLDDEKVKNLYKSVKERYFKGKSITANDFDKLTEFLGHVYFAIPAIIWLQDRIKRVTSPSYFCQFSYVGNEKTPTDLLVKRQASGASHVDDIAYLLYLPKCKVENPDPPAVGTKDRITLERMTRMWTNFAKTGDPVSIKDEFVNIDWNPVSTDEFSYLDIGEELQIFPVPEHLLFFEQAL